MGVVGKNPNPRRSVSVQSAVFEEKSFAVGAGPSQKETAAYIAEISGELVMMAKRADLSLLAHLLAMAHAEAAGIADL